ncbi:hypothetical protein C2845_PM17G05460 [Panicum miliaceum]|uniref:Uncharacterized protein n=1 Tax=Panicum miliaceum TaxID=4540 RepID=A0A3L6Q4W1_PANMI|nr:hypothetical protein C2845_PM17G05460 [Panicum miliaceum]
MKAWEYSRQLARRRLELELISREAAEELSEGGKDRFDGAPALQPPSAAAAAGGDQQQQSRLARISSETQIISNDEDEAAKDDRNLYIVLISINGLVRGENMEIGYDSDTGASCPDCDLLHLLLDTELSYSYPGMLARALAAAAGVHLVDLLTRQISCPDVDWTYGEPVEMITRPSDTDDGGDGGAYIVRLPCGPRDQYLPKESLWPHIPEFVDRALAHVTNVARALGDQLSGGGADGAGAAAPVWPYVIHGHYADAAEVAAHLASAFNVPMVMTGHSLGRNKLEQLLKLGRMPRAEIQGSYRIARRIEAEETGLDAAEVVVTSTKQEIEEQWGL